MNSDVLGFILAGGRGTRMGPLCLHRPKPLLPMGLHHKLIDFPLINALRAGIQQVGVLADYQRDALAGYLRQLEAWSPPHHRRLDVLVPRIGSYSGTANAVFENLRYLEASGARTVLILAADHVYFMDYKPLLEFHLDNRADLTMSAVEVAPEEAHRFGILTVAGDSQVVQFEEKPAFAKGRLASMGIYAFSTRFLQRVLRIDAADPGSSHDFGHSVIPRAIVDGARVFAHRFSGFWRDVGTLQTFHETNLLMLESGSHPLPSASAGRPFPLRQSQRRAEGPDNSLVSPASRVDGEVCNSVIGPQCVVAEGAVVRNSVLFSNVRVGRNSVVDTAVIDDGAVVGDYCYVGTHPASSNGAGQLTTIGHNGHVATGTMMLAGRRLWPDAMIDSQGKGLLKTRH